jgi:hypothetical protein
VHQSLIEKLRRMPGIVVEETTSSWLVHIPERGGCRFEIVVPMDVLEWFADAYDAATGNKLWSDWSAWYSLKGGPSEAELPSLFAQDVEFFISRLMSSEAYRVSRVPVIRLFGRTLASASRLEARVDGAWKEISVGVLPLA